MTAQDNHFTYRITEAQFIAAQRLHVSLRSPGQKLLLRITRVVSAAIIAGSLYKSTYWLALGGLIGLSHTWLSWVLSTVPQLMRSYRSSPALQQPFAAELRDGQLLTGLESEGQLPWDHIIAWAEDGHSLLLYLQPQYFLIFPKTENADSPFLANLREQLLAHVGQPRK